MTHLILIYDNDPKQFPTKLWESHTEFTLAETNSLLAEDFIKFFEQDAPIMVTVKGSTILDELGPGNFLAFLEKYDVKLVCLANVEEIDGSDTHKIYETIMKETPSIEYIYREETDDMYKHFVEAVTEEFLG